MRRRGLLPVLVLLPLLLTAGCAQATTDPDAAVRALLINHWKPDWRVSGNAGQMLMTLSSGGTGILDAATTCTWTYSSSTLTIRSSFGTDTTVNPTVTATTLVCTVNGVTESFTTLDPP